MQDKRPNACTTASAPKRPVRFLMRVIWQEKEYLGFVTSFSQKTFSLFFSFGCCHEQTWCSVTGWKQYSEKKITKNYAQTTGWSSPLDFSMCKSIHFSLHLTNGVLIFLTCFPYSPNDIMPKTKCCVVWVPQSPRLWAGIKKNHRHLHHLSLGI